MNSNTKMICFDMDGTIADFYGVDNWLDYLNHESCKPYTEAQPLCDMNKLNEVCELLRSAGWEINIITWLSKNASKEYKKAIRLAKREWLNKWGFVYDHFHGVQYGTPKTKCVRRRAIKAILIDDDKRVRQKWNLGEVVNPVEINIIDFLENLL